MNDEDDNCPPIQPLDNMFDQNPNRFFSQRNDQIEQTGNWLIVFGFAPNQLSEILRYLSINIGQIVDTKSYGSQCNWVEVLFESDLSYEKALTMNGKIIPMKNIIIGVIKKGQRKLEAVKKDNRSGIQNIFASKDPFKEPPLWKKIIDHIFGI